MTSNQFPPLKNYFSVPFLNGSEHLFLPRSDSFYMAAHGHVLCAHILYFRFSDWFIALYDSFDIE